MWPCEGRRRCRFCPPRTQSAPRATLHVPGALDNELGFFAAQGVRVGAGREPCCRSPPSRSHNVVHSLALRIPINFCRAARRRFMLRPRGCIRRGTGRVPARRGPASPLARQVLSFRRSPFFIPWPLCPTAFTAETKTPGASIRLQPSHQPWLRPPRPPSPVSRSSRWHPMVRHRPNTG